MSAHTVSLEEFAAVLRRWFLADALPEAELRRLHASWLELASDEARVRGQDAFFEPRARIASGYDWWEERQRGRREPIWPDDASSRVAMFLTSEGPPAGPMPTPRPHCPPMLAGRWRCIGRGPRYGDEVVGVERLREWVLTADGRVATVGDPTRDGLKWWAHRSAGPDDLELWLGPSTPRIGVEPWNVVALRGDEMDLSGPETPGGFLRWARVPSSETP